MRPAALNWPACFLLLLAPGVARADEPELAFTEANLPTAWTLERTIEIPEGRLPALAEKFGGRITRVANQFLSVNGFPGQVNTVVCATEDDGAHVYEALVHFKSADYVFRRNRLVYEVVGGGLPLAKRIRAVLGIAPVGEATYEAVFRLGCVDRLDYMDANPVFNLFLKREKKGASEALDAEIRSRTEGWEMGSTLHLRTGARADFEASYTFVPEPDVAIAVGEVTTYLFGDPPNLLGIPYVDVTARVRVAARYTGIDAAVEEADRAATPFFPADDPAVRDLATKLTAGLEDPRARVLAILRHAGVTMRYDGQTGSRYGTLQALEQNFGHCWDKSDVFITLSRAAGIPARQVAGWLPTLHSGHIWAEVFVENEGWISVDATTTWLGTSEDYIPWMETRSGDMPVVHLRWPEIRKVE
jgi:hypothetical protein